AASDGAGDGGTVKLVSGVLRVDFALISTTAFSTGHGGNVNIIADNLELSGFGAIESSTDGSINPFSPNFGNAGDVFVNATSILINGAGKGRRTMGILAASRQGSTGNGGNLIVKGDRLFLENGGAISASSSSAALAGSVQLTLGTLTMESDSSISSGNT